MSSVRDVVDSVDRIIVRDAVWDAVGPRGAVCTDVEDIVRPVGDAVEDSIQNTMKDLTP